MSWEPDGPWLRAFQEQKIARPVGEGTCSHCGSQAFHVFLTTAPQLTQHLLSAVQGSSGLHPNCATSNSSTVKWGTNNTWLRTAYNRVRLVAQVGHTLPPPSYSPSLCRTPRGVLSTPAAVIKILRPLANLEITGMCC